MNISRVVIHELEKQQGIVGANLTAFDSTIDHTDEKVVDLIKELNNRYRNRNETYGIFDNEDPTVFHKSFDKYHEKQTDKTFVDFTKDASTDLKIRVNNIPSAKGGYLIFAHYEYFQNFVSVFLVRNTTGLTLKKSALGKKFDLDNVQHIDFENLAMACRINLDNFKKEDMRYLSFISKKGDDNTSKFFTGWLSSCPLESNKEDTQGLFSLFQNVDLPIDIETGESRTRQELLEFVHTVIKNTSKGTVNIRNISKAIYDDENFLPTYIEQNKIIINGEFKAHPSTLKKFIHIKAKADNVELSFPHTAYRSIVRFDERDPSQIIVRSQSLVDQIRLSLNNED
jgi:nucleoid-associated protein YejK